jgi:uncharacterized protein YecE (DUF72 family)
MMQLNEFQKRLADLACRGVYLGTSSWKYPGWCGQIYQRDRYVWRGRWSETRFERDCLSEYGQVFKSVCVDAAYYSFPSRSYLEGLASQVPDDFLFSFKVTDRVTVKRFPNLPRFGARAGTENADFLNADLFATGFLAPCEFIRPKVGMLMFEFSRFYPSDFERGREFVQVLDEFLSRLPPGWNYGVEIRNKQFLRPEYFGMLGRHNVAHVFNSWSGMPPLDEQIASAGSFTCPECFGARLLLRPGRKYEEAVKLFKPYDAIKEEYPEGRKAGVQLVKKGLDSPGKTRAYIYVNNRFEGNALHTIDAVIEETMRDA